jgi:hypothetical protein
MVQFTLRGGRDFAGTSKEIQTSALSSFEGFVRLKTAQNLPSFEEPVAFERMLARASSSQPFDPLVVR